MLFFIWILFQVSQWIHTTDALQLCWLGFGRMRWCLGDLSFCPAVFFPVCVMAFISASSPKLVSFPRSVATMRSLLGGLAPLCVADVAVYSCTELFATDVSLNKGATVKSCIDKSLATCLWRCCRSKCGYSKLLPPSQSVWLLLVLQF